MEYIVPKNNYLAVLSSGKGKGFVDYEEAKAYINRYFMENLNRQGRKNIYANYDMYEEKSTEDIAFVLGAENDGVSIYMIEDIIDYIRDMEIATIDEKEEIISKLLNEECNIDIYTAGIKSILENINPVFL
ncbi:hypothetical protein M4I33_12560 [Clostridium sp. LY3-2]|uniref:hypothetical protein n=1 Tax=Clostridium sp. LY3-2 TaxID=2942482 RepID=UPI0021525309|nr:hypothetical protein [Clostridium sp. LY3-2]MCR6515701.1 hypothetical protein [Clostridium sp. LY3-2]